MNFRKNHIFSLVKCLLILGYLTLSVHMSAQINKDGILQIKNYSPEIYNAHSQNWAIVKDNRGNMYFANNFGVLQFNGANWQLFENEHSSAIRSLAVDKNGLVYYGSAQDFGVLLPNKKGELKLTSLFRLYSREDADFNDIWCINTIQDDVFFQSNEKLFQLKLPFDISDTVASKKKFTVYKPESAFHWSFSVYNQFYIREYNKGLFVLKNDKLELVPGGEVFANLKIYAMLPYMEGIILVVTREKGLFLFNPKAKANAIIEFKCEANQLLIESLVYGGTDLSNDQYAIATLTNGVIIINNKGQVLEHLNTNSGLPDQQIYSVFSDKSSGNLWFTTSENGIFNAYTGSPFREWNKINGINGVVSDMVRFNNKVYAATNTGIYYLDESISGFSTFQLAKGQLSESWDLQLVDLGKTFGQRLLAATAGGIFELKDNTFVLIGQEGYTFQLSQSKVDKNIVYIGYSDGFGMIEFNNQSGKWKVPVRNKLINYTIRSIYENPDGELILGTQVSGFVKLQNAFDPNPVVIDSLKGLPINGSDFKVFQIENDIVLATYNGLFLFNNQNNTVLPYNRFGNEYSNNNFGVFNIEPDSDGYWISLYSNKLKINNWQGIKKFVKKNGEYSTEEAFSKLIPQKVALSMLNDGKNFWVANEKGLYKFDSRKKKIYDYDFRVNIVKVTSTNDSILFGGSYLHQDKNTVSVLLDQPIETIPILEYKNNQIKFEYASAFYEKEENTEYSFRLIGLDDNWTKWSVETKFPFTNLPPGKFRFEVKARNLYGKISNTAYFEFEVLPPWYLTIYAYISFFILLVLFIWLVVKLNIKRLQMDKERLEGIVNERTTEIRLKNIKLEQQKEEIQAQRDQLEIQRDKVTLQKEQIEDQNKNITDSIQYASKIQEALLPPEEVLNDLLPEHFILFLPRDIVSGDFYWTNKKDNKTILAAADCTGHGVPGAFMSMLGITFLNEITNKGKFSKASEILDELRESVKTALRQTGKDNEAKDGMDISLCIIDYDTMTMQFSGAYNSLLMIRDSQVLKFEANRMPIGIYPKEKGGFTNYEIDIKKGDCFYIYSDGYIDQFGGANGTKLLIKKFKELILENHLKAANEQKIALENFLKKWLSFTNSSGETYKQIDDILVIGLKF